MVVTADRLLPFTFPFFFMHSAHKALLQHLHLVVVSSKMMLAFSVNYLNSVDLSFSIYLLRVGLGLSYFLLSLGTRRCAVMQREAWSILNTSSLWPHLWPPLQGCLYSTFHIDFSLTDLYWMSANFEGTCEYQL